MLLPMLRIRLNSAVASVRSSGASVAKVMVLSGTKMKPRPRPWTKPAADDRPGADVGREARHLPERERGQAEAGEDQQARVDPADQAADQEHRDHGAEAARRQEVAGGQHRIAHQVLQERRQQRQRREQDDADHEDEQQAGREVAVAEQRRLDERAASRSSCGRGTGRGTGRQTPPRRRSRSSRTSPAARRGRASSAARRSRG